MEFVAKYCIEFVLGIISTSMLGAIRYMFVKLRAQSRGVQALLRDRIVQAYYHYCEDKVITLHGLENVNAMYAEYHSLGGNGTVTKLVEEMRKYEVVDRRDKYNEKN